MKKLLFSLLLSAVTAGAAIAQTTISGRIVDSRSGEPLPGTHIRVEGTNIGTIASAGGEFVLKTSAAYTGRKITCSLLGYNSTSMPIPAASQSNMRIALSQRPVDIDRVVVMPEDRLRVLLEAAYRRIPDNYYTQTTQLTGFFRESSRNDTGDYYYFSEAVVDARLNSYTTKDDPQIRIVKSMAGEFPALDSLGHRWMGAIFNFTDSDFVKKGAAFINPSHYKDYIYTLDPMSEIDGRPVYVISFRPKNDNKPNVSGKLYLDEKTLAYHGAEYERNAAALKHAITPNWQGIECYSEKTKIEYAESEDHKMYLKYHLCEFDIEREDIVLEYVTTNLSTGSVTNLPYTEQIEQSDIFLEKAKQYYDENYWEEYNVFARDSTLDAQMKARFDTSSQQRIFTDHAEAMADKKANEAKAMRRIERFNKFLSITTKIGARLSFTYLPVTGDAGVYGLSIGGTPVALSEELSAFKFIPAYTQQLDYNIDKFWSVNYSGSSSFGKRFYYASLALGVTRNIPLNRWGRQWIAEVGLGWSFGSVARNFSDFEGNDDLRIFGKRFDARQVRLGVGYATTGATAHVGISHRLSSLWWIHAGARAYIPVRTRQMVVVREKSGFFLTRKSASEKLDSDNITLTVDGVPTTNSNISPLRWSASIGIMLKF